MLELFSRNPDVLKPVKDSQLTPIPFGEEVSSLSAILLDDDYYAFITTYKIVLNELSMVDAKVLIPLKAKAWLDLSDRAANGERIDSKTIKKHKNDIVRLFSILSPELRIVLPNSVGTDFDLFLKMFSLETINFKQLELGEMTMDEFISGLSLIFG
jgi:hypothetical protein